MRATIDPTARVAADAAIEGDVRIGAGARVLSGARLIAEGGTLTIGPTTIVMECAVVRATARHSTRIGAHCLIGPHAHVVGCTVEDEVFIATRASVFHGAVLERRSEVRIGGVVHLRSRLPAGGVVPIGWIGVGDPIEILPPDQHDRIWQVQERLDFPGFVYGVDRSPEMMVRVTEWMADHLAPGGEAPGGDTDVAIRPLADGDAEHCDAILHALPEWFGIEAATAQHCRDLRAKETFVAWRDGERVGFVVLHPHNAHTVEMHLIAVRPDVHRRGIGRRLVAHAEALCRRRGHTFLQVKTLGPSRPNAAYDATRRFYEAQGFEPLEENALWGEGLPCLILVKHLRAGS